MSETFTSRPAGMNPAHMPPRSDTQLPVTIGVTTALLSLAVITYILRIYSRCRKYINLGWDDAAITLALILTLATWANNILVQLIDTGGKHTFYITPDKLERSAKLGFVGMPLWIWSVTMIKVSVFLMLLRIKQTPRFKAGVWACIGFVVICGILASLSEFLQCRPIEANWSLKLKRVKGLCWSLTTQINIIYVMTALFAATDIATSLLPLIFIRNINKPFREKVVLAVLMGMGLVACACGLVKPFLLKKVLFSPDPIWDGTQIKIWSYAEQYVGIIAANIPTLKGVMEKAFKALGGKLTSKNTSENSYPPKYHRRSVKPQRSDGDDEYHESLRHVDKESGAYGYQNYDGYGRVDSYEQILMDHYPTEPKKVRLVDERSVSTGKDSRFVVKQVDEKRAKWDGQRQGMAL